MTVALVLAAGVAAMAAAVILAGRSARRRESRLERMADATPTVAEILRGETDRTEEWRQ